MRGARRLGPLRGLSRPAESDRRARRRRIGGEPATAGTRPAAANERTKKPARNLAPRSVPFRSDSSARRPEVAYKPETEPGAVTVSRDRVLDRHHVMVRRNEAVERSVGTKTLWSGVLVLALGQRERKERSLRLASHLGRVRASGRKQPRGCTARSLAASVALARLSTDGIVRIGTPA